MSSHADSDSPNQAQQPRGGGGGNRARGDNRGRGNQGGRGKGQSGRGGGQGGRGGGQGGRGGFRGGRGRGQGSATPSAATPAGPAQSGDVASPTPSGLSRLEDLRLGNATSNVAVADPARSPGEINEDAGSDRDRDSDNEDGNGGDVPMMPFDYTGPWGMPTLPPALQFAEPSGEDLYRPRIDGKDVSAVHRDYRGCDRKPLPEAVRDGFVERTPAIIGIAREDASAKVFGNLFGGSASFVRVQLCRDTQIPCVKIFIVKTNAAPGTPPMQFLIFADHVDGTPEDPIAWGVNTNETPHPDLETARDDPTVSVGHLGITLKPNAGVWIGCDRAEREKWLQRLTDGQRLTPDQTLVAELVRGGTLCLWMSWKGLPKTGAADLTSALTYFAAVMLTCVREGNLWFYKRQQAAKFDDDDYPFDELEVPRWMVTRWTVHFVNGVPTSCEPLTWATFVTPDIWPDHVSYGFLTRLAQFRERTHRSRAIRAMMERLGEGDEETISGLHARFLEDKKQKGKYLVEIRFGDATGDDTVEDQLLRLAVDTRVTIDIDEGFETEPFHGFVVDLQPGSTAELAVVATSRPRQQKKFPAEHPVSLRIVDDTTSLVRLEQAVQQLQQPSRVEQGVDLPHLLLGSPRSGPKSGWMQAWLHAETGRMGRFNTLVQSAGLDVEQQNAARLICKSPTDAALIHGPAGTGKSRTLAVSIVAQVGVGLKVLAAAPSNAAVEALLRQVTSAAGVMKQEVNCVRFRGSYAMVDLERRNLAAGEARDADDARNAYFLALMVDKDRADQDPYAFHVKRQRWTETMAADLEADGTLRAICADFCTVVGRLRHHQYRSRDDRDADEIHFHQLESTVNQAFFAIIDAVFVTCNSATHELLRTHFRPQICNIDNCATSSVVETSCPLMSFDHTVRATVLSGDHRQLRPVVLSRRANEGHAILERSLFEQLIGQPKDRVTIKVLGTQYRMQPHIVQFVADHVYRDLKTAPSAKVQSAYLGTIREFMSARLGTAWNERNRMAVNCVGLSETYEGSTSRKNDHEVEMLLNVVEQLLQYQPQEKEFLPVPPERMIIMTPYTGQRHTLTAAIKRRCRVSKSDVGLDRVPVTSVNMAQGQEAEIAFLSLVVHPESVKEVTRVGFVADPAKLVVELTRPRSFLWMCGDFQRWVQAIEDDAFGWRMKLFGQLIRDLDRKLDILPDALVTSAFHPSRPSVPTKGNLFEKEISRKGGDTMEQRLQRERGERKRKRQDLTALKKARKKPTPGLG